jgi:hypothetical protein
MKHLSLLLTGFAALSARMLAAPPLAEGPSSAEYGVVLNLSGKSAQPNQLEARFTL